jgi:2-phosphoglycerate kinase
MSQTIYLIGGAPRLGKSLVAAQLMKETGFPWLATDALSSAILPFRSLWDEENLLPTTEAVRLELQDSVSLEKPLRSFLDYYIHSKQDCIVEGIHLLPATIHQWGNEHCANLRCIFLLSNDAKQILKGIADHQEPSNWLSDASEKVLRGVADFTVTLSKYFETEAEKYHLPVFYRTNDFERDKIDIIHKLQEMK